MKNWYLLRQNEKAGPYEEAEMIMLIKKGILTQNDSVWMFDLKDWVKVGESVYRFYIAEENN